MDKKYLFMVLVGVMFIIGCEGEQKVVTIGETPYIGGSKGLIAEFLQMGIYNDESNMEEIFEGETFPIEVVLKNRFSIGKTYTFELFEHQNATRAYLSIYLGDRNLFESRQIRRYFANIVRFHPEIQLVVNRSEKLFHHSCGIERF